ncbi:hypothetical protein [Flavobacterium mesophilum]|uniref:hypothetical protein n=1 Tax=Flavobacterium mesophilum TaxID=3143495 RepID=UPI0031CF604F
MTKLLLFFFTILICYSCEIQYDGGTRLVVEGQLVSRNGNPIPNKRIEITNYSDGTYTPSDLISFTKTDSEGKFRMIFPAPKGDDITITTELNGYNFDDEYSTLNNTTGFQNKRIDALRKNFTNYKLDLNKVTLFKNEEITELQIILNKTSTNKQITALHVDGIAAEDYIDLNYKNENQQNLQTQFSVIKNQNITLSYTIADYSDPTKVVTTNHEANIAINSDKVIHAITY